MPCPRDVASLRHICALSWICGKKKKNMRRKTVAIHNVFKKKTTKLNSQPAQYEKK